MVDQLNAFGGKGSVSGTWKDLTDNVNAMAASLTSQVRDIAMVASALSVGDLSQKITVEAKGEIQELKSTINGMVDKLGTIIGEINDVMALVGEGRLRE
ncbi:MAG: HAMP domain-containing protein [Candidatus Brocadiaceae bacterium]